jgi:hypothetical protein
MRRGASARGEEGAALAGLQSYLRAQPHELAQRATRRVGDRFLEGFESFGRHRRYSSYAGLARFVSRHPMCSPGAGADASLDRDTREAKSD